MATVIFKFQQEAIDLLSYYYWNIIGYKASFELMPYDSENETFIITSNLFGDLAIKVPITKAQIFKDNFYSLKFIQDKSYLEKDKLSKNIVLTLSLLPTLVAPVSKLNIELICDDALVYGFLIVLK